MKRRLILMRHAKSSWDHPDLSDHDRPLNGRGRRDAPAIATHLQDIGWVVDKVVSSSSERTRETWALMEEVWDEPTEVSFTRALFHGGPHEIRAVIAQQDDALSSLMLLGHNPGWSSAAEWFSGQRAYMTTANAALLSIEADTWRSALAQPGKWTLHDILRPKDL